MMYFWWFSNTVVNTHLSTSLLARCLSDVESRIAYFSISPGGLDESRNREDAGIRRRGRSYYGQSPYDVSRCFIHKHTPTAPSSVCSSVPFRGSLRCRAAESDSERIAANATWSDADVTLRSTRRGTTGTFKKVSVPLYIAAFWRASPLTAETSRYGVPSTSRYSLTHVSSIEKCPLSW